MKPKKSRLFVRSIAGMTACTLTMAAAINSPWLIASASAESGKKDPASIAITESNSSLPNPAVPFQPSIVTEGDHLVVTVEGAGNSRTDALNQAWLEAIRLAVGMMIEARTEINQNEVAEHIISHSRGVIDKYEILIADESKADQGLYKVRMKATVQSDVLRDGLQYVASGGQVITFSPNDLKPKKTLSPEVIESADAEAATASNRAAEAAKLLATTIQRYKYNDFMILKAVSSLRAVEGNEDAFEMDFEISFNEPLYYEKYLPEMQRVLDQISDSAETQYIRDTSSIRVIRQLGDEGAASPKNESVYVGMIPRDESKVILLGPANKFKFTVYTVDQSVLDGARNLIPAESDNSTLDYRVSFYDDRDNELFSVLDRIPASTTRIGGPRRYPARMMTQPLSAFLNNPPTEKREILQVDDIIGVREILIYSYPTNCV